MVRRLLAVLLIVEALVQVVLSTSQIASIVTIAILVLVSSAATLLALLVLAVLDRRPLVIASAACWLAWWLVAGYALYWLVKVVHGANAEDAPQVGMLPIGLGVLAGLGLAIAHARQRGGRALVLLYLGFAATWFLGERWWIAALTTDDLASVAALRRFADVGYIGWHIVLAIATWRAVTTRRAAP